MSRELNPATISDLTLGRRPGSVQTSGGIGGVAGGGGVTEGGRKVSSDPRSGPLARRGMAPQAENIARSQVTSDLPSGPARASQTTIESSLATVRSRARED